MTHIVLRIPLRDNEEQASVMIYGTALKQSMLALKLSKKNIMLQEFSNTLCVSTLRVLANTSVMYKDEPCAKVGPQVLMQYGSTLVTTILPIVAELAEEDDCPGQWFVLLEQVVVAFGVLGSPEGIS